MKKRYSAWIDLTEEDWSKVHSPKLKDSNLNETKLVLQAVENRASRIIEKMEEFSFDEFEKSYFISNHKKTGNSFISLFKSDIENLRKEERIGTATSYNTTLNSILEFKKDIQFKDLTAAFLHGYEKYLLNKPSSITTVGIYMRQLRAIINQAMDAGLIKSENYPFKHYVIPGGRNIKKALSFSDIKLLLDYETENLNQQKALDLWLFSYLANGMNMADMAYLKHSNLEGNFLYYIRTKTKRTKKKDLRPIKVALNERAKEIINTYKTDPSDNPYLFDILQPGLSPVTTKNRIRRIIKFTNRNMREIISDIGIQSHVTFSWGRHCYSTVLKRKGVTISEISESLGHSSLTVTSSYLDSFTDDSKLAQSAMLTNL